MILHNEEAYIAKYQTHYTYECNNICIQITIACKVLIRISQVFFDISISN